MTLRTTVTSQAAVIRRNAAANTSTADLYSDLAFSNVNQLFCVPKPTDPENFIEIRSQLF